VIEIDESEFPLVLVHFRNGVGQDDWDAYVSMSQRHFDAGERFGLALRTTNLSMPPIRLLKDIGKWVNVNGETMGRHMVCTSLCIPSPLIRGAIKFINHVAPPPVEQALFSDWDEALSWAHKRIRESL